jgi:hypothetical protein
VIKDSSRGPNVEAKRANLRKRQEAWAQHGGVLDSQVPVVSLVSQPIKVLMPILSALANCSRYELTESNAISLSSWEVAYLNLHADVEYARRRQSGLIARWRYAASRYF